jgi:hypothetical protein
MVSVVGGSGTHTRGVIVICSSEISGRIFSLKGTHENNSCIRHKSNNCQRSATPMRGHNVATMSEH